MSLKDRLMTDLKEAMLAHDTIRKNTIQLARAEILKWEKDNAAVADDVCIEAIIAAEVKKRNKALVDFAEKEEYCNQTKMEIEVLEQYLPKQLTDQELSYELDAIIRQLGATSMKDMGIVMKEAKMQLGNTVDGKRLSDFVKIGLENMK